MISPASAQALYEITCKILHKTFQLKNKTNNSRTKGVLFQDLNLPPSECFIPRNKHSVNKQWWCPGATPSDSLKTIPK